MKLLYHIYIALSDSSKRCICVY